MLAHQDPFSGQAVDMGRPDNPNAEAAQVAVAEVVGENDYDVWLQRMGRFREGASHCS